MSLPSRAAAVSSRSAAASSAVLICPASLTTGTTSPRGDWAAKPRWTAPCCTISPAAVSTEELSSGCRRRPATTMRAISASTPMPSSGRTRLSASLTAMSSVASASTQVVASGISRREVLSLSAIALRTPVSGTRISACPGRPAARTSVGDDAAAEGGAVDTPVVGAAAGAAEASTTSARRMMPSGLFGRIEARSRPASRASLRTSGEMHLDGTVAGGGRRRGRRARPPRGAVRRGAGGAHHHWCRSR